MSMKKSDEILLNGLKPFGLRFVGEAEWALLEKAVDEAGSITAVDSTVRYILEKASFASRSEAARYAANMRWRGSNPKGLEGAQADARAKAEAPTKQVISPEEAQIVVETLNSDTASIYRRMREQEGKTHSEAYSEAKAEAAAARRAKAGFQDITKPPRGLNRAGAEAKAERQAAAEGEKPKEDKAAKKQRVAEIRSTLKDKDLSGIAGAIRREFRSQGKQIPPALAPYLDAMGSLGSVKDRYFEDSGSSIVAYALSNMGSFKGDAAAAIKEELKARLKG